tara:strand:+ start:36 stop:1115 length:1080 start_codon:yes stop_codon:yes gene_type:complete
MSKKNFWKNKTVLITGHTGFKGSWLTLLLKNLGAEIIGYALDPISKPNFFDNLNLSKYLKKDYRENILNLKKLKNVMKRSKPSIVFHLAAQSSVLVSYKDSKQTVETNVLGTANFLESIKNVKSIKSAIIVTTDKVYLNLEKKQKFKESAKLGGYDIYSSSKAACEIITESYIKSFFQGTNCNLATVRSGNCIGGGDWTKDRIIKDCVESFLKNKNLILRSPNATRPWQHVLEPLSGYLKLSEKLYYDKSDKYSGAWNFGPNVKNNLKVKQIASIGKKIFHSKSKIVIKDKKYYESKNLSLDSSKSFKLLKWKTILSDAEALKMTFDWFLTYYKKRKKINLVNFSLRQIELFKKKVNLK